MNFGRRALAAALLVFATLSVWSIMSPRLSAAPTDTDCMGGPATIKGDTDANPGDGTITGTDGNDVIVGTEANDNIQSGAGDDRVCGLGGDDTLDGGDGFDRQNGGPGQDTCNAERQVNCEVSKAGTPPAPAPTPPPA